jgi:hypothetical protein
MVFWMIFVLFLGLWGGLEPLNIKKSSSSLFVSAIAKFGHIDPTLPEDEPFLSSGEADKFPLSLLLLTVRSMFSDVTMRTALLCCCCVDDIIFAAASEFLLL